MGHTSADFWLFDPCVLLDLKHIVPSKHMSLDAKLNAVTRLAIIISLVMYFMKVKYWFVFLVLALMMVVFVKLNCGSREGFSVTPNFVSSDFDQTIVSPLFAEEWDIIPPSYDTFTDVGPANSIPGFQGASATLPPQSRPFRQYLTKTNMLPSDEFHLHTGYGGMRTARDFANSAFLRRELAFRDDMSRIYRKKLQRRFRGNCQDTVSPYQSS